MLEKIHIFGVWLMTLFNWLSVILGSAGAMFLMLVKNVKDEFIQITPMQEKIGISLVAFLCGFAIKYLVNRATQAQYNKHNDEDKHNIEERFASIENSIRQIHNGLSTLSGKFDIFIQSSNLLEDLKFITNNSNDLIKIIKEKKEDSNEDNKHKK